MRKNMSTWGKDRWVPRGSPCHRWNILKLSILPPPLGTVSCWERLLFFLKDPGAVSDWPIQNCWPVMMYWQCNHPAFLAMSNLFEKMEIRIISPDGAGKHMPISMEIHGNHMGIHRMSMVFEKLPEGETANQSPKLRLPWRLIPIVCLSEICLSKCWFKREHVGYCWLFHNVKSAILDIVDYVSFICLFSLLLLVFVVSFPPFVCVCVSENRVTINHVNPQIYHKFLYFFMFKNWRILLGSFFFMFPCWFSRDDRIMIIPCWSSLWKKTL